MYVTHVANLIKFLNLGHFEPNHIYLLFPLHIFIDIIIFN